jgi:hypothetical protein
VRIAIATLTTLLACRDRAPDEALARRSPIETAIARDLTARFGTPVTTKCWFAINVPVKCAATLHDGTELPIAIDNASKTEWGWRVDGLVIHTAPVREHVQAALAALHVTQTASCGNPIVVIPPGERLTCPLSGGGAAFVTVAADGSTSLEVELDPTAAAARSEERTADRDHALATESKALESQGGETDGEEAVGDGGVTNP